MANSSFLTTIQFSQLLKPITAKAEFAEEGTFYLRTDFLPLELLLIKKLEIEKTKTTCIISVLKVVYKVGLVLSNSNFFINKNSQGRKSV